MTFYRADFYFFRHFLTGLGSFRDRKVTSHSATKLVFGINRPFRIRLDSRWQAARVVLIDSDTPHLLNGEGDWQIVLWMDDDTNLADILRQRSLKGRPWALHRVDPIPTLQEIVQTAGDSPDAAGALRLSEFLVRVYAGARSVPANWDFDVKKAVGLIDRKPGEIRAASLARALGREVVGLDADFRRVMGLPLNAYIHRRRWFGYIKHRHSGTDRDTALRLAGLPGWEGLQNRFEERYGLDLEVLEKSLPFVRVYDGDDVPVLFL